MSTLAVQPKQQQDDLLDLLPNRPETLYQKRASILLSPGLYLVRQGRIAVRYGSIIAEICGPEDLFETFGVSKGAAIALDDAALLHWSRPEVETLIKRTPLLGVLLLRLAAERAEAQAERIERTARLTTTERLSATLLDFAERFGVRSQDGSITMLPFTHQVLADYLGTTREIVTQGLNILRRAGALRYSRAEITVWPERLRAHVEDL